MFDKWLEHYKNSNRSRGSMLNFGRFSPLRGAKQACPLLSAYIPLKAMQLMAAVSSCEATLLMPVEQSWRSDLYQNERPLAPFE